MFSYDPQEASNARFYLFGAVLGAVWITMSLRVWVRIKRSFTWGDITCLLSTLLFTGFCTTAVLVETTSDCGVDAPQRDRLFVALSMASTELYVAAIGFLKISIALLYLQYIKSVWQRTVVQGIMLVNIASTVVLLVATVLECGALLNYKPSEAPRACLPTTTLHIIELSTSISNAATSWALAIIPIFIVASRAQRLSTHQKLCTGCVLLLGGCTSVVSVIKVLCVVGTSVTREAYLVPLSVLECGIATVAVSAVTLQPLFRCLSRSPPAAGYIDRSGSEKGPREYEGPFTYEGDAPSKSHFSIFSEASFGPKTWFKGLQDGSQNDRPVCKNGLATRTQIGPSILQKPIRKISDGDQALCQPSLGSARPPPLNRTESQQFLLRNESDSSSSSAAGVRHLRSSSKPLKMYGEAQQYI